MKYIELVGRFLYSIIFLKTIMNHFTAEAIGYAVFSGIPVAYVLVPLSGILAIVGAISIILGYKTKWGGLINSRISYSCYFVYACLLEGNRSHGNAKTNDELYEKHFHAWGCIDHQLFWSRPLKYRCKNEKIV